MSDTFEPRGYVAGVSCDPNAPGSYVPIVTRYDAGKPPVLAWVGERRLHIHEAMRAATDHQVDNFGPPSYTAIVAALNSLLWRATQCGNMLAFTGSSEFKLATDLAARVTHQDL